MRLFSGARPRSIWTSGSSLGAQSAPRWCSTGEEVNITEHRWQSSTGTVPSTDVNKYVIVFYADDPASPDSSYLKNVPEELTQAYPLCED